MVWSIFALISLLSVGVLYAKPAQFSEPDSYKSQSEYLLTFAEFVEWPVSAGNQNTSPVFSFCVLGRDPYGSLLDKAILGHLVGQRRTVITRAHRLVDLGACDMLFISSSEEKHEVAILKKLQNHEVLTIGDTSSFAAHGGIIQFVREQNHLGFLINVDAAERARLKIDASLLALAQIVHEPAKADADDVH